MVLYFKVIKNNLLYRRASLLKNVLLTFGKKFSSASNALWTEMIVK